MQNNIYIVCCLLAFAQARTIQPSAIYKPRIVHGEYAKLGEIPYQVSMQVNGDHWCGGSIINQYWIVTAAHCARGRRAANVEIVTGTVSLKNPHMSHHAVQIIVHRDFAPLDSYKNDIALIKVATPFEFSFRVQPAILPAAHAKVKTNSTTVVSGWGKTHNGSYPDILQKATAYIIDPKVCQAVVHEWGYNIHPTQFCANDTTSQTGECDGDSGGPVTVDGVLTGIVSWSIPSLVCGSTRYPSVYTRVSEYIDWINELIK